MHKSHMLALAELNGRVLLETFVFTLQLLARAAAVIKVYEFEGNQYMTIHRLSALTQGI